MQGELRIRPERPDDRGAVFSVHCDAFGRRDEAELVDALRASATPSVSLVADRKGSVVGHVFVSPVRVEGRAPVCACGGLAPLGVERALHGQGIGSALMRAAEPAARAAGFGAVFLLGDPDYYARFGFRLAAPLGFRYESERFDPAFQVRELEPGALEGASGRVHYAPPFGRL